MKLNVTIYIYIYIYIYILSRSTSYNQNQPRENCVDHGLKNLNTDKCGLLTQMLWKLAASVAQALCEFWMFKNLILSIWDGKFYKHPDSHSPVFPIRTLCDMVFPIMLWSLPQPPRIAIYFYCPLFWVIWACFAHQCHEYFRVYCILFCTDGRVVLRSYTQNVLFVIRSFLSQYTQTLKFTL